MSILAIATFDRIFPSFEQQIQKLHELLLPVAIVLIIVGLLSALRYAYTPRSIMRALMLSALITASIAFWSDWMNLVQESTQSLVNEMDANPQNAANRYVELIIENSGGNEKPVSILKIRLSMISDIFVTGVLKIIGVVATFMIWIAYIIQKFFLGFSYALAPIFLGMFALRSTSSIALRFVMTTIGLLVWPLGWAAAAIATSNLIDVFTIQNLASHIAPYSQQSALGAAIIGLWIIASTLLAPVVIQRVISSGANIGSALASGALTGSADAAKAGLGAAAAIAATGGSGAVLAGLGGVAAMGSSAAGSTMRGGGGGFSGNSVQNIASRMRGITSSTSSTGSKSSNPSTSQTPKQIASSPSNSDLTGDKSVAALLTNKTS